MGANDQGFNQRGMMAAKPNDSDSLITLARALIKEFDKEFEQFQEKEKEIQETKEQLGLALDILIDNDLADHYRHELRKQIISQLLV